MANNILFNGIKRVPGDITNQDGDLMECINLESVSGELKPVPLPQKVMSKFTDNLIGVHNIENDKNFVTLKKDKDDSIIKIYSNIGTSIYITGEDGNNADSLTFYDTEIFSVEFVGNVIVFSTNKGMKYLRWMDTKNKYIILSSDKLNVPDMRFWIKDDSIFLKRNAIDVNVSSSKVGINNDGHLYFSDSEAAFTAIEQTLKTEAKNIISDAHDKCRFLFPFFIRYGIRMFDGSYYYISQPILMQPSNDKPALFYTVSAMNVTSTNPGAVNIAHLQLFCSCSEMMFSISQYTLPDEFKDLITYLDVFISPMFYNYKDDFDNNDYNDLFFNNSQFINVEYDDSWNMLKDYTGKKYCKQEITHVISDNIRYEVNRINLTQKADGTYYNMSLGKFPIVDNNVQFDNVTNNGIFFRVKSFNINELKSGKYETMKDIDINEITSMPSLQENAFTISDIYSKVSYNYNNRIILGDIYRRNISSDYKFGLIATGEWGQNDYKVNNISYHNKVQDYWFDIDMTTNFVVAVSNGTFLFYPNADCDKLYVEIDGLGYIIPMVEHNVLNGSYWFDGFKSFIENKGSFVTDVIQSNSDVNSFSREQNLIFQSNVSNPFSFNVNNTVEVGKRAITGIIANMQAVSQGQFGQYPLMIFTEDGIYSLGIASDGTFNDFSPISTDILKGDKDINRKPFVSANQCVIFLSERGLMAASGSSVLCISESLDGNVMNPGNDFVPKNSVDFISSDDILEEYMDNMTGACLDGTEFKTFCNDAFLSYDYSHDRIIILNSNYEYSYIYSIRYKTWYKIYSSGIRYKSAINNFTETYLQGDNNSIYDVMQEDNSKFINGLFISRPIRFSNDNYKTIKRILHRVQKTDSESFVKMLLYGSRDGNTFYQITSLRGTSFRSFVFIIYVHLRPNDRYSYLSVDWEEKLNDKLR